MTKRPIYLDYHATTPVDPQVLAAMLPCFKEAFGNAASKSHLFGWRASELVDHGRVQVAQLIGATPQEIVFTSGATESNNLALKGIAGMYRERGNHIVTTAIEHKSVLDSCKALEKQGMRVTYLPVDHTGLIDLNQLRAALTEHTILISVMYVNGEVGTIEPVQEVGRLAKERGIFFHCDATQAVGKIPVHVTELGIDLLSCSAHKMYGPKGIGALYVRHKHPRVRLTPLIDGGGHEGGLRSGTLNVPGIVGFGKACAIAHQVLPDEAVRILGLREQLRKGLAAELDDLFLNGHPTERLPHNLNLSVAGVEAESLLMDLAEDIAVSSGSACASGSREPSYVLKALGVTEELIHTAIRFGLGRFTQAADIEYTIERVTSAVKRLRAVSPIYELAKEETH